MTNITIEVRGADARKISQEGVLTTGMVGAVAYFLFDAEWDNLDKTAIFDGGSAKVDVKIEDGQALIPPETLTEKGNLRVGVEGRSEDGSIVIPTVWVEDIFVRTGANATGNPASAPEAPNWAKAVLFAPQDLNEEEKAQARKNIGIDDESPDDEDAVDKEYVDALVAGKIDAPSVAEVGQTIVVKSVDENGKPTEWEAADLPAGGNASESATPIELIKTVTVPADIANDTSDVVWSQSSGDTTKPYKFEVDTEPLKYLVIIYSGGSEGSTVAGSQASAQLIGDATYTTLASGFVANTAHGRSALLVWDGCIVLQTAQSTTWGSMSWSVPRIDHSIPTTAGLTQVSRIAIWNWNNDAYWAEGTTFKIYGVRA